MIILGSPKDDELDQYICLDGPIANGAHAAGIPPKYKDADGFLWFKRTKKLLRFLADISYEPRYIKESEKHQKVLFWNMQAVRCLNEDE